MHTQKDMRRFLYLTVDCQNSSFLTFSEHLYPVYRTFQSLCVRVSSEAGSISGVLLGKVIFLFVIQTDLPITDWKLNLKGFSSCVPWKPCLPVESKLTLGMDVTMFWTKTCLLWLKCYSYRHFYCFRLGCKNKDSFNLRLNLIRV